MEVMDIYNQIRYYQIDQCYHSKVSTYLVNYKIFVHSHVLL